MGKTSLKTFVCSFVLSLFAILSVNKEFFGVSKPSEHELKIPTKNISLFFKDMPVQTAAIKTIPIKKIALSVPVSANIEKIQTVAKEELIPLTFAANDTLSEQSTSLEPEPETPAETPSQIVYMPEKEQSPPEKSSGKDAMAKKIAANYQEIIQHAPPANEAEMRDEEDDVKPFSNKMIQASVKIIRPNENRADEKLKAASGKETVLAQADIPLETSPLQKQEEFQETPKATEAPSLEPESFTIARVPDETDEEDIVSEDDAALPPTFKVAKASPNPDTAVSPAQPAAIKAATNEPENLLIPLQKDNGGRIETAEAKITKEPDSDKLAMLTGKATIRSMAEGETKNKSKSPAASGWKTMAEKNNEDSVWIAAKGTGHHRNSQLANEKYFKEADSQAVKQTIEAGNQIKKRSHSNNVKVASEIVNNLLIPIPEDILNDPNLTPQLVSSDKDKNIEEQLTEQENFGTVRKQKTAPASSPAPQTAGEASPSNSKGLLKSITSIFSKDNQPTPSETEDNSSSGFLNSLRGNSQKKAYSGKILPTEIRLAFQPGRAEISGGTLKWIQAFANKTIEDDSAGLEIRIDGSSSYELQQKRLNLLHNILTNSGVDYRKINTIFTTREPNSFIIRTVRLNNNTNGGIKEDNEWQDYYRAW